jgi:hypothetical protein
MASGRQIPEPSELIYLPQPSWKPAFIAVGLAGVVGSLFTWWPYGVAGAIIALVAAVAWIRDAREDFGRLPRRQRIATGALPAVTLRRGSE